MTLALAAVLGSAGCGGIPQVTPPPATGPFRVPPPPATALDSAFLLESGGPPAEDTAVAVQPGGTRAVLLRRGPPDNSLFATLVFADSGLTAAATVTVSPRPGLYAVDVTTDGAWPGPAALRMSYAVHFVAPAGARERYGNDLGFERALFLARLDGDSTVVFLPTGRPGSDLVEAVIDRPGRYVVAAPRR